MVKRNHCKKTSSKEKRKTRRRPFRDTGGKSRTLSDRERTGGFIWKGELETATWWDIQTVPFYPCKSRSILNIYWKKYHSTWKIQTWTSVKTCYRGQQVFLKSAESQRKNKTAKRRSKFSQGTRYLPLTSYGLNIEKFCNKENSIPLTKSAKKWTI